MVVIEKNPKYRPVLKGRFGNDPKLEIILNDALFYRLPVFDVVISNLPYMISEPILHRLFKYQFRKASFIVSKGFADRLTEVDSKLGYMIQYLYNVENIAEVPAESYLPPPNTQTSIVTLTPRNPETTAQTVIQAIYRQEDKKTANAIREALIQTQVVETKRQAKSQIEKLAIPDMLLTTPVARLSFDQILDLSRIIESRVS